MTFIKEMEGDWGPGEACKRSDVGHLKNTKGWVSTWKRAGSSPAHFQCRLVSIHEPFETNDRVLLKTPEGRISSKDSHAARSPKQLVQRKEIQEGSIDECHGNDEHPDDKDQRWLREKIVQCGKVIGVSVEEDKGG